VVMASRDYLHPDNNLGVHMREVGPLGPA
jgi:hypothetical protein